MVRVCANVVLVHGAGVGRLNADFLPEESEPDDAGFLLLLVGIVRTAAGSTQSEAKVASAPHGETHCALVGLTEILVTGETAACATAGTLPLTFSDCLLAEKLLHMQSRMMMELRLPKSFSVSGMHGLSQSSS